VVAVALGELEQGGVAHGAGEVQMQMRFGELFQGSPRRQWVDLIS
jgi:hypothetical protein